jgi:hypothetical protein
MTDPTPPPAAADAESRLREFAHGGPAYPLTIQLDGGGSLTHFGMTLRDYFAGQALAGIIAHPKSSDASVPGVGPIMAEEAYFLADCMLAARSDAAA